MPDSYDVALLGSGPGGYVAAIRGAQLGLKVAIVERDVVGGVCLNWGCIPSKALLKNAEVLSYLHRADEFGFAFDNLRTDYGAAVTRSRAVVKKLTTGVAGLLKKNRVDVIQGSGRLKSASEIEVSTADGSRLVTARHLVIATGGRARHIPGVAVDGEVVVTSREAIVQDSVPPRCVIIGGGAIGAEFAYIFRTYGAEVTIVELLPRLLPSEDEQVSAALAKEFARQGIGLELGARVESVAVDGAIARVTVSQGDQRRTIEAERVIVAIGIQGNVENLGLEELGIAVERSFIQVDDVMQTSVPGVFAIGDVNGKLLLAHVAFRQGELTMEHLAGLPTRPIDYEFVPRATYCQPQVASFGLTEVQAREAGHDVVAFSYPYRGNGKALALGESEGFIKIVTDRRYGEILGAHLIGTEVTELLPELTLARQLEASVLEIGDSIHAHPTLSEMLKEASLGALGRAIHL